MRTLVLNAGYEPLAVVSFKRALVLVMNEKASVIEHVAPHDRPAFAAEVAGVAGRVFVQTPAWSFPVEPHALLPFAHWLPTGLRRRYWSLGAAGDWEDIALLRKRELAALFPGARITAERIGPLAKSWVAVS